MHIPPNIIHSKLIRDYKVYKMGSVEHDIRDIVLLVMSILTTLYVLSQGKTVVPVLGSWSLDRRAWILFVLLMPVATCISLIFEKQQNHSDLEVYRASGLFIMSFVLCLRLVKTLWSLGRHTPVIRYDTHVIFSFLIMTIACGEYVIHLFVHSDKLDQGYNAFILFSALLFLVTFIQLTLVPLPTIEFDFNIIDAYIYTKDCSKFVESHRSVAQGTNFWSVVTFQWLSPLLKVGEVRQLNPDDLFEIPRSDYPWHWADMFYNQMNHREAHSLLRVLRRTVGQDFYRLVVLRVINVCLDFTGPVVLKVLVGFIDSYNPSTDLWKGIVLVLAIPVWYFIMAIIGTQYNVQVVKISMRLRACLVSAVFRKVMITYRWVI